MEQMEVVIDGRLGDEKVDRAFHRHSPPAKLKGCSGGLGSGLPGIPQVKERQAAGRMGHQGHYGRRTGCRRILTRTLGAQRDNRRGRLIFVGESVLEELALAAEGEAGGASLLHQRDLLRDQAGDVHCLGSCLP